MSDAEQIDAFKTELDKLVGRFCAEFQLTTAGAIGVLEIKKHELIATAIVNAEDDDE